MTLLMMCYIKSEILLSSSTPKILISNAIFLKLDMFVSSPTKVQRQRHLQNWDSFLGIQQPGREINHSLLPSTKIKSEWSYTSTSPICLNGQGKPYLGSLNMSVQTGSTEHRQGSHAYLHIHNYLTTYMSLNNVNKYGNQYKKLVFLKYTLRT
jgi:hypothetical protein